MSKSTKDGKKILPFRSSTKSEGTPLQKGQVVIFEGEEAEVLRIRPFYVIKTKNRLVCGALQNRYQYAI